MTIAELQPKSKNSQQRQLLRVYEKPSRTTKKELSMKIVADNTKFNQGKHLNNIDKYDRLMAQLKSAILCLSSNNNFENLNTEVVANMFWLIEDHLDGLEATHADILGGL